MIKNYLVKSIIILLAATTLFLVLDQKVDERIAIMQKINNNQQHSVSFVFNHKMYNRFFNIKLYGIKYEITQKLPCFFYHHFFNFFTRMHNSISAAGDKRDLSTQYDDEKIGFACI